MAKAAPPTRSVNDKSEVDYLVAEYVHLRNSEKELAARKKIIRDQLIDIVEQVGEFDSNGNQFIELEPGSDASLMQRQRRVQRGLDMEAATEIMEEKGLADQAFIMVPTLDTEFVWKQVFEGRISDDELERIFPSKETFALVVE